MEFAVNPQQAGAAANQTGSAAGEFSAMRQQFASIVERAADASGDLGIKGHCLAYHDEWSQAITQIEQQGTGTGGALTDVTARAVTTGDEVSGGFTSSGDSISDPARINRAING